MNSSVICDDAVTFIGLVRSPWDSRETCPRNMEQARSRGGTSTLDFSPEYRPGLLGLDAFSSIIVLTWMHEAERDVLIQYPHSSPNPRGVFSIRSPARPNPIGFYVVKLFSTDLDRGLLLTEALDCRDGTPIIDVKPYYPGLDIPPDLNAG